MWWNRDWQTNNFDNLADNTDDPLNMETFTPLESAIHQLKSQDQYNPVPFEERTQEGRLAPARTEESGLGEDEREYNSIVPPTQMNSTSPQRIRRIEKGPYKGFVPDNWPANRSVAR